MRITVLYQENEFEDYEKREIEERLNSFGLEVEGDVKLIKSAKKEIRLIRVEIFKRLPKFLKQIFYAYARRIYPRCRYYVSLRRVRESYWIDVIGIFEEIYKYAIEEEKKNVVFVVKMPIVRAFDLKMDGGLSYSLRDVNLAICGSESIEDLVKLIIHEIWHWRIFRGWKDLIKRVQ
jgi:hypothetical protein